MTYTSFRAAFAALILFSCQSNSYEIDGYAREFQDGDTICLKSEEEPDTLIGYTLVSEGKFSFEGETPSTRLCRVYASRQPEQGIDFFLEPGDITIELSESPANTRVSGTKVNNQWQLLSDSIQLLAQETFKLLRTPTPDSLSPTARAKKVDSLHRRMSACIENSARRNSGNALGRYIEENYKAPEFE